MGKSAESKQIIAEYETLKKLLSNFDFKVHSFDPGVAFLVGDALSRTKGGYCHLDASAWRAIKPLFNELAKLRADRLNALKLNFGDKKSGKFKAIKDFCDEVHATEDFAQARAQNKHLSYISKFLCASSLNGGLAMTRAGAINFLTIVYPNIYQI